MAELRRNRTEQRLARMLAASEGIKYTEALRRVRAFQKANEKKEEAMTYCVIDAEGENVMGDRELTPYLKEQADKLGGHIINDQTGETVYPVEETTDETVPPLAGPLSVEE